MTFYVLLSFFILWSRGTLGAPVRPNETSLYFPGVPCLPSACNYSVAGVAGILVSSSPSNVVRQPTDETFLMTIGGMDPDGFLQSSVRLTNISDLIKGLDPHWFTPKFCGATVLTPLDELLEGFASPSWCAQTSKNLIYFMDLKSSPILLYSLNLVTWSWTRLDGGKLEPTPRQLYAVIHTSHSSSRELTL